MQVLVSSCIFSGLILLQNISEVVVPCVQAGPSSSAALGAPAPQLQLSRPQ